MKNSLKVKLKIFKNKFIALLARMHFWGNPSRKLKVVGVTGTNGKTTTATLLYRVATELGYKAGLIGTVENIIDLEVIPATNTTPGAIYLNRLMNKMVKRECEYVFMEVSSHAMDQGRVSGINFTGGIFTNLTHDHLDYHKNLLNYFLAKKKFFEMLPKNAFALSNKDDKHGNEMLRGIKAKQYLYGFDGGVDFLGEILKLDFNGLQMKFNNQLVNSHLLGKFNAYNLLTVYSTCYLLGFDMEKVVKILENIEPPRGRFEHFVTRGVLNIVDYAHTPDALEKVLLTIKELKPKESRIISVFGCGGDRDPIKRKIMGMLGATLSDIAIFTSDNPRSEHPEKIIDQMMVDLTEEVEKKVICIVDRHEAIKKAVQLASEGDIILCAGKGHETYQEIKGVKHHFDDREELENAFDYGNK